MNDRLPFNPLQAQEVDVFPAKSVENGQRMVKALLKLGFNLDDNTQAEIIRDKDFVQLKGGPYDLDLIFAPDGIESFAAAKARAVQEDIFPVANLRDIIASKKASGRMKDRLDLHLLELFRLEFGFKLKAVRLGA
ncbi:MAG: hypothetical protein KA004_13580 [Verrucomicrobiales bacterium]|nr:hypothetical protein [Verrucomicrobiales bacterium]